MIKKGERKRKPKEGKKYISHLCMSNCPFDPSPQFLTTFSNDTGHL